MNRAGRAAGLVIRTSLSSLLVGVFIGVPLGVMYSVTQILKNRNFMGLFQVAVLGLWFWGLVLVALYMNASRLRARRPRKACVVVLGDLGRSPRMQNHALSLANAGWQVSLVGYLESPLPQHLAQHSKVSVVQIATPFRLPRHSKLLYILLAPLAALSRAIQLGLSILRGGAKGVLLLQNPPSIPTLLVARLLTWFGDGAALVVDWHNYGYTIMETTGAPSYMVKLARVYEKAVGRFADAHFCVSNAMKKDLERSWKIRGAVVLYDRPPSRFRRTPVAERLELFSRLEESNILKASDFFQDPSNPSSSLKTDRPALLISSTSWTPDEDFGVLLTALKELDMMLRSSALGSDGGKVKIVITGKGPLREKFEQEVASSGLEKVAVSTAFLKPEDYPKLLGSADLGISLHYSSSGLDLPMKVVDMFGCQLPVLSVKYNCIDELVEHDKNGLLFEDARQLAQQVFSLVRGFPGDQEKLDSMREAVVQFQSSKWEDEWTRAAAPVLKSLVGAS